MCFINSISSGERIDSIPGRWGEKASFEGGDIASIPGRIKIRPGTYCRGDSAHALQITQNMGNRTTNVKPANADIVIETHGVPYGHAKLILCFTDFPRHIFVEYTKK